MVEDEPPAQTPPQVPVWAPFAVLAAALLFLVAFQTAVFGIVKLSNPRVKDPQDLSEWAQIGLTFVQDGVFVLFAVLAVRLALGTARPADFGLRRPANVRRAVKYAALVYFGFWLTTILLAAIFGQPGDQELVSDLKSEHTLGVLVAWAVLICVVAPFVEEFFFRGFLFGTLVRRLGPAWAVPLVGVVFGLGHAPAPWISLVALGVFGAGLCLLYWRTQSIIPCMALHALNNSITFGLVKSLDAGLFAGLVVASVATVTVAATALSARPRPVAA